mgnify:CR=1 FL=1
MLGPWFSRTSAELTEWTESNDLLRSRAETDQKKEVKMSTEILRENQASEERDAKGSLYFNWRGATQMGQGTDSNDVGCRGDGVGGWENAFASEAKKSKIIMLSGFRKRNCCIENNHKQQQKTCAETELALYSHGF